MVTLEAKNFTKHLVNNNKTIVVLRTVYSIFADEKWEQKIQLSAIQGRQQLLQ